VSLAVDEDLAGVRGLDAEQGEAHVGAPRSDEARETEHLARVGIKGDPLESTFPAEVANGKKRVAALLVALLWAVAPGVEFADIAADHVADDLFGGCLGSQPG